MDIQEKIKKDMTVAMKAKDSLRVGVLRSLLSAFTNELVRQKKKPAEPLPDEDALKVIKREANQRKDSISQFKKGGREDLSKEEKKELKIIEEYLPEELSDEELRGIVDSKIKELGVSDKSGMGKLMGAVMEEVREKADGRRVKEIVEKKLG